MDERETESGTVQEEAADGAALERYRTLVGATGDGVYQLDADGRFVAVNDVVVETTGYARESLLGERLSALLDEAGNARLDRELRRFREGDGDDGVLLRRAVETADGDRVPCELRLKPFAADGEFAGVVGTARTVGERGRVEADLEEVVGRIDDAFYAVNEDWELTYVNDVLAELAGRSRGDLLGENVRDAFPEAVGAELEELDRRATDAGESAQYETYFDGADRWFRATVYPSDSGRTVILHDITQQKRIETEFEEILGRVSDAFYALDDEFRFTHVNDRAAELLRRPEEELLGKSLWDTYPEAADVDEVRDAFYTAMETQEQTGYELYFEPLDFWVRATVYPSETGVSVYFRDITERKEMEHELRESEEKFRQVAENIDQVVWMSTPEKSDHLYVNPAYEDIWGRSRDSLYENPRSFLEAIHPDDRERVREALPDQIRGEYDEEYRVVRPDGEVSWVRDRAVPIRDEDGEVYRIVGIADDVTERHEAERELRDAKEQLEAAAEAGAVGTWEWRIPEDEFVAGASLARTFGVDPEEARGGVSLDRFVSAIHEEDRDRVEALVEAAVESCGEYEAEYRVRNVDGELRWVVARGHVECDDEGEATTFPGALADITARKRAEVALQESQRQLRTLFDLLPVGVVVADPDGRVVESNNAAREIWGADAFDAGSVAESTRFSVTWADTGEPVAPEEWTMARVLDGEEVTDPDVYEITAADGERRIVMVHGEPIRNESGEVTRGVVTHTDITRRREYQRKLEQTVEQLEASNERLEQFAYAASHDLQEPLRMVSSYLQLLERRYEGALDEDGEEFLAFAVDGADRMREMVDALLEYSRVETRGDPFEPIELDAVLEDVLDDLRMKIEESGAHIEIGPLPRVYGDESQLRQVFQNLLQNAIAYSGDEPPRIRISAERSGAEWTVAVRDEGIGIDPEYADDVFEVFNRLHTHDEHPGTGIGLALSQRIVERHGGDIWVDSEPEEGSTFSFTLPATKARARRV